MEGILRSVEQEYPQFARDRRPIVRDLQETLFGPVRTPLLMLLAATGGVLVLGCANLAHLFMSRFQGRRREFGVRLALGAGRWRLVRLLTIESAIRMAGGATAAGIRRMVIAGALVPAVLGMAAGTGVALWWAPTLQSLLFGIGPSDPLTYAASAAVVTFVVLAGSLVPAWRASRVAPTVALRAE